MRRLGVLAAREAMSVSAFAVRELAVVSRRADNAALLGDLPDLDVTVSDIVALAEELDCPLLTADARLAAAGGPRCTFTVVSH